MPIIAVMAGHIERQQIRTTVESEEVRGDIPEIKAEVDSPIGAAAVTGGKTDEQDWKNPYVEIGFGC